VGQIDFKVENASLLAGDGHGTFPSFLPSGGWALNYHLAPLPSETALIDVLLRNEIATPICVSLRLRGQDSDPKQFGWLSLDGDRVSFGLYVTQDSLNRLISFYQSNIFPKFLTIRTNDIDYDSNSEDMIQIIKKQVVIIQSYNLVFE
jgi:hypothetical protein